MSIKIIDESISLTREEYTKYMDAWRKLCMHSASPPIFETFVKEQRRELNESQQKLLNE